MNVSAFVDAPDWTGWQLRYPVWHAYHSLGQSRTSGGDDLRRSIRGNSTRHLNVVVAAAADSTLSAAAAAAAAASRHSIVSTDSLARSNPRLSRVKALLANLGNALGYDRNSRTNWFDDRTSDGADASADVSFNEFVEYFDGSLLSLLQTFQGGIAGRQVEEVENLCWLLARTKYLEDRVNRPSRVLSDVDARRLWDVFNFFAEEEPTEDEDDINLFMDKEEVGLVIETLMTTLGKGFDVDEFDDLTEGTPAFDFFLFLNPLEIWYFHDQEAASVEAVVKELWLRVKSDVLKRGYVNRRGLAVTGWKRRWLTLSPGLLEMHANEAAAETALVAASSAETNNNNNNNGGSNSDKNNAKTMRIRLGPNSSVQSLPASYTRLGPFAVPHAFALKDVVAENNPGGKDNNSAGGGGKDNNNKQKDNNPTGNNNNNNNNKKTHFEFSVGNFREKNEWMTAFRKGIEGNPGGRGINQSGHRKRFLARRTKRRKAAEAEAETNDIKERLRRKSHVVKVDLENEKRKRKEEEEEKEKVRGLHEEEKKRREELQTVNCELEKLLVEERHLRRDEELVRSAQARFIADELEVEANVVEAERLEKQLAQVKLEKEMEITDALLKEKWAVERELESARQELDAIESTRDAAEKKLQSLMRKCGVKRLPSANGGRITVADGTNEKEEEEEEEEEEVEMGIGVRDDVDGGTALDADTSLEDQMPRRTSCVNGNAIFSLPSLFPSSDDDDVFFLSSDSSDIVLSPVDATAPKTTTTTTTTTKAFEEKGKARLGTDRIVGATETRGAPCPQPAPRGTASSRLLRTELDFIVPREGVAAPSIATVDPNRARDAVHAADAFSIDAVAGAASTRTTTTQQRRRQSPVAATTASASASSSAAAAACFLPAAAAASPARNYELSSEETPPALNNGKSASTTTTTTTIGLVRRSSTLKTGEINLKKKLIIRRNSSRVANKEQNQHNLDSSTSRRPIAR